MSPRITRTVTTLVFSLVVVGSWAAAQRHNSAERRPFRIGLLSDTAYFSEHATDLQWDAAEQLAGLRQGMKDLGVVEGTDWILIPRLANRDHNLLDTYASELVAMKVDVIAASSTTAAMAAARLTRTIPIVAWGSLGGAVPAGGGTNVTGFEQPPVSEYISQLRMFVPDLKRLAVLYDPTYAVAPPMLTDLKRIAAQQGLELVPVDVGDNDDLAPGFDKITQQRAQAVIVLNHRKFLQERDKLAALGIQHRLPMLSPYRQLAEAGVLIAHHPDWEKIWRRAAKLISEVLSGTPAGQIPPQTGDMRIYVNVKTAHALGLTIPDALRANVELIGADAPADTPTAQPQTTTADEAAIRAIIADNARAFNRQDAEGTVARRTEAFDHINVAGAWASGRAQLQNEMVEYFKAHRPTMTTSVEKIRFLTPEVAYAIVKRQYKDEKGTRNAISTSVFHKVNGKWWDEAFQNTFIQPSTQSTSDRQSAAADEREIARLEDQCLQATLRGDTDFPEKYFADEYTQIALGGNLTSKQDQIRFRQRGQIVYQALDLKDRTIRVYGDVAVVVMHSYAKYTGNGRPIEGDFRATRVWHRQNGNWKIVAFQTNKVSDTDGPLSSNHSHDTSQDHPPADTKDENVFDVRALLLRLEATRRYALLNGDADVLQHLLADDFIEITGRGVVRRKPDNLTDLRSGRLKVTRADASDEEVHIFGSFAVYSAIYRGEGVMAGQPFGGTTRISRTYMQRNGKWVCVYAQGTRLENAAPSPHAADMPNAPGSSEQFLVAEDRALGARR